MLDLSEMHRDLIQKSTDERISTFVPFGHNFVACCIDLLRIENIFKNTSKESVYACFDSQEVSSIEFQFQAPLFGTI